ncbi:hypothetical protein SAMN04489844_0140 [Nocardioides exalbidus]|uniref:Uncharacterized protein n=1 Tax=Nocardioides exalbidus TaxID=402596 RepID=A0A1H4JJ17_9ACTN|nr:hypothetical protein [Nocardioides exalbidus]SEB45622.1 hypothetical protein SAMN04489844_0140 [Nocardioides exalbidus]
MDVRATPLVRCLRALLLAAVVVAAGSLAHLTAAGRMPDWPGLVALYAVVAAACALALGREASAPRLVALTVGGQLVVHGALSGMAGHDPGQMSQAMAHGPHGGMVHPGSTSFLPEWLSHGVEDMLAHPFMAVLHVLAATTVGLWLAVGERALFSLVRLARCGARAALARAAGALGLLPVVLRGVPRLVGVRRRLVDPLPLLPVWSRGPARRGPPPVLLPR